MCMLGTQRVTHFSIQSGWPPPGLRQDWADDGSISSHGYCMVLGREREWIENVKVKASNVRESCQRLLPRDLDPLLN
jgi:hypothetical protein